MLSTKLLMQYIFMLNNLLPFSYITDIPSVSLWLLKNIQINISKQKT